MQKDKVNVVQDWPTPSKKKQVQAFLGFANYVMASFRRHLPKHGVV